ncbi:hypothetical protein MMC11_001344 [Xylographa trunciseda]|nr:hypothetical protein [Xylographa trunciseda]
MLALNDIQSEVHIAVYLPDIDHGHVMDAHLKRCEGRGCAYHTCSGGYTEVIFQLYEDKYAIEIHERPQHNVTALHSRRTKFDFEISNFIESEIQPDGSRSPQERGPPTFQRSILDATYKKLADQIMKRNVFGCIDVYILAHRNNLTGAVTCLVETEDADSKPHPFPESRLLQQIAADRAKTAVQPSPGREISESIQERRSQRCKKWATRRRKT